MSVDRKRVFVVTSTLETAPSAAPLAVNVRRKRWPIDFVVGDSGEIGQQIWIIPAAWPDARCAVELGRLSAIQLAQSGHQFDVELDVLTLEIARELIHRLRPELARPLYE